MAPVTGPAEAGWRSAPDRNSIAEITKAINEALEAAASADYSLDALLASDSPGH